MPNFVSGCRLWICTWLELSAEPHLTEMQNFTPAESYILTIILDCPKHCPILKLFLAAMADCNPISDLQKEYPNPQYMGREISLILPLPIFAYDRKVTLLKNCCLV